MGAVPLTDETALRALFARCSNWGRWGPDDELGTLNLITPEVVLRAGAEIREGRTVSMADDLTLDGPASPRPTVHFMVYGGPHSQSALDFIGLVPHGFVTHLDALGHYSFDGFVYNGRPLDEALGSAGLQFASILAQRDGIVTRGVLLDVAAARGTDWLEAGDYVTVDDLDAAERLTGGRVEPGDAVVVHVGLEARQRVRGPEDPRLRTGLDAASVAWLHDRQVSLYTGDCIERLPYPSAAMPMPLHSIALVSMGLVLLDCPRLATLTEVARELGRSTFLFTCAPIRVPGGTGSPVNPVAVF